MTHAANDNATPAVAPFTVRTWARHIAGYHPFRAANSYAKHVLDIPADLRSACEALTAAVMCGMPYNSERHRFDFDSAVDHIRERVQARIDRVSA